MMMFWLLLLLLLCLFLLLMSLALGLALGFRVTYTCPNPLTTIRHSKSQWVPGWLKCAQICRRTWGCLCYLSSSVPLPSILRPLATNCSLFWLYQTCPSYWLRSAGDGRRRRRHSFPQQHLGWPAAVLCLFLPAHIAPLFNTLWGKRT